jgi:molybdopterin-guanine dinucleotide biosynthesis protein A
MSGPTESLPLGGVLVGGQSRRFGTDKAVANLGGRSMAAWAVRALRAASDPVVLLGGDGSLAQRLALPWRADLQRGAGPMAGVATGLHWAAEIDRMGLLVLACDLPLVAPAVVTAIAAAAGPEVDAVVAVTDTDGTQPLCAWYGPGALPSAEACLESGTHAMRGLLEHVRVAYVHVDEGLFNVNTPADLAAASERIQADSHS